MIIDILCRDSFSSVIGFIPNISLKSRWILCACFSDHALDSWRSFSLDESGKWRRVVYCTEKRNLACTSHAPAKGSYFSFLNSWSYSKWLWLMWKLWRWVDSSCIAKSIYMEDHELFWADLNGVIFSWDDDWDYASQGPLVFHKIHFSNTPKFSVCA